MKNYVLIILLLILNELSAQNSLSITADSFRMQGMLKEAIDFYKKIPRNDATSYEISKAYALLRQNDSVFTYLEESLKFDSTIRVIIEPNFMSVIEDKRWGEIENKQIEKTEAKYGKYKNINLAKELWRLKMKDQAYYYHISVAEKKFGAYSPIEWALWDIKGIYNKETLGQLEEIIRKHGWPKISEVKGGAAQTAFLIIQHSSLEKQKKYIPLLKENCEKNEANWADYALMYDRILIAEGKKQLYGSQLRYNQDKSKYELRPIEDEHNVDKRRKSMGLNTLKEYVKEWDIDYNVPQND